MLKMVSNPERLCVTLEDAKAHLRVDQANEDSTITDYLDAAIDDAAIYTSRALNKADYTASFDEWPACRYFDIPIAPIEAVDAVKYFDQDGDEVSIDADSWDFVETPEGGRVYFVDGFEFPTLRVGNPPDRIYIELTAGYDVDDGSTDYEPGFKFPAVAKAAILLTVGHLYANREAVVVGRTATVLPAGAERLLDRLRIYR